MRPSRFGIVGALALALACGPSDAPRTASGTALRVFDLARQTDVSPDLLDELFADAGDADRRASLYDALAELAQASGVRVTSAEALEGLNTTAVDLSGDLPGGGRADFSVHVETVAGGTWKVTWLAGPGVEWPPRRPGRGSGLSTSAPPPAPDPA